MIPTTLVLGAGARARERAVASLLRPGETAAVILEGLPDGTAELDASPGLSVARIAPGCLCCTGNLVLRVTLNRMLRGAPGRLFVGLADAAHAGQLRSWLQSTPYDQLLEVGPDHWA
ncbi:MAG: GTPase [Telluria sp.]